MRAFDPAGDQQWSFTAGGAILGSPVAVLPKESAAPCDIVAGSADGNVYGLSPLQGTRIWTLNLGGSPIGGSLVPVNQFGQDVVAVSNAGHVVVFNGCTGGPGWSTSAPSTTTCTR